jgi:hypothetical protein
MSRKTATLFIVYLSQDTAGKAEPYRHEWQEMPMAGGARLLLPPSGRLVEEREVLHSKSREAWLNFGLSTSGKAGAPCVAIGRKPKRIYLVEGDLIHTNIDVSARRNEDIGNTFGVMDLIDFGEFNRQLHLMLAALPAIWKVKKAAKA